MRWCSPFGLRAADGRQARRVPEQSSRRSHAPGVQDVLFAELHPRASSTAAGVPVVSPLRCSAVRTAGGQLQPVRRKHQRGPPSCRQRRAIVSEAHQHLRPSVHSQPPQPTRSNTRPRGAGGQQQGRSPRPAAQAGRLGRRVARRTRWARLRPRTTPAQGSARGVVASRRRGLPAFGAVRAGSRLHLRTAGRCTSGAASFPRRRSAMTECPPGQRWHSARIPPSPPGADRSLTLGSAAPPPLAIPCRRLAAVPPGIQDHARWSEHARVGGEPTAAAGPEAELDPAAGPLTRLHAAHYADYLRQRGPCLACLGL